MASPSQVRAEARRAARHMEDVSAAELERRAELRRQGYKVARRRAAHRAARRMEGPGFSG